MELNMNEMADGTLQNGLIIKAIGGFYYVEAARVLYECKARGIFRNRGEKPLVGDMVEITVETRASDPGDHPKNTGVLENIRGRKNSLIRPPLANIDRLYIISSYDSPQPNGLIIDKLIAAAEQKEIEPVLVFNKSDQGDFSHWKEIYEKAGFSVFVISCESGDGIDSIAADIRSGISVFTGNSGVGKSSLLNRLYPALGLATGEVSEKLGRGRHTTRHVELYKTGTGGYIADTPGFSSLDLERSEIVLKENLPYSFREFEPYHLSCKFTSCSHTGEKGCAVCEAVEKGEIGQERYQSYCLMYGEVKDLKEWQLNK